MELGIVDVQLPKLSITERNAMKIDMSEEASFAVAIVAVVLGIVICVMSFTSCEKRAIEAGVGGAAYQKYQDRAAE